MIFIHCIPRKQNEKSFNYLYHINYNIIKSSIPPLFSQDSRISKECNPSTTWSNPAMEKNTYTPGEESRYIIHPSIEVQQARKPSTCIQELRF